MTDINRLLRDSDPVQQEEGLSFDEVQAIRREMLGAMAEPVAAAPPWRRPVTIAAAAALIVGIGGLIERRDSSTIDRPIERSIASNDSGSSIDTGRRQLQFATPGGTRIIWIFNQNLKLQESMP